MSSLSIQNIVDVTVTIEQALASTNSFNQGLYIGPSSVIPTYGSGNTRVRQYSAANYATQMLTDGFQVNSPEYLAAQAYFSQSPQPGYLWIGRRDTSAIQTATLDVGGSGWNVGDQFTIGSASNYAIGQVTAVNAGAVTAFTVVQQGTGFTVENAVPCTAIAPSTGTGLEVNITAIGETPLQAAIACQAASTAWYGLAIYGTQDADILAVSAWADSNAMTVRYYPLLTDAAVIGSGNTDIASQLQTLNYRVFPIYSTQQGGTYPGNAFADAAVMGMEAGYQTGLAGSFFTAAHKTLSGIAPEPLTQSQYSTVLSKNCNVYVTIGSQNMLEQGLLSNGQQSFVWLYIPILVNQIQANVLNVLSSQPAIPQNAAGQQKLIDGVTQACEYLANIGFLSGGTWQGQTINIVGVTLEDGQAIPNGYLIQSQPYSQQSQADRNAGKAMPIYVAITSAGGVLSVLIGVYAQI